jgi:hypothetical protein
MILPWLTLFNTLIAPVVGAVLKLLFQMKIIKSEAELAETQRRFEAAIKAADKIKGDSVDAQKQFDGASKAAEAEWRKTFGG